MTLHTVLIAVTVDTKHSASAVRSEIIHAAECISSELFDSCTNVGVAKFIKPKTYVVWNAESIANSTASPEHAVDTYAKLVEFEHSTGYSYSSVITTNDIRSVEVAVLNEFNGDLQSHLIDEA